MNKVSVLEGADGSPPFWSDFRAWLKIQAKHTQVLVVSCFQKHHPYHLLVVKRKTLFAEGFFDGLNLKFKDDDFEVCEDVDNESCFAIVSVFEDNDFGLFEPVG